MGPLLWVAVACLAWGESDGPPLPGISYEAMRSSTGRGASDQVRLALWCEAHGLEKERLKHLAIAVLSDPSNAMARGLLGLVEVGGKWLRPEAVERDQKADLAHADLLAAYNGRRVKAAVKVDPQYKLALWCLDNGLVAEARAHLATVVRLDPNHADAWKKLGYKKAGGRWVTDAKAVADRSEKSLQDAADKVWNPKLVRLRDALAARGDRSEAFRDLDAITDPRAVPMIWKVFVLKDAKHHASAIQLFGQIDAASSSRALAVLALSSKSDDARRRAVETLRRKDPREYADLLILRLRDKVKYEVKPVGGPGSAGELYVEGEKVNVKRRYAPPAPQIATMPGDTLEYDANGQPVLVHHQTQPYYVDPRVEAAAGAATPIGGSSGQAGTPSGGRTAGSSRGTAAPNGANAFLPGLAALEGAAGVFDPVVQGQMNDYQMFLNRSVYNQTPGSSSTRTLGYVQDVQTRVPVGQILAEADRAAASAKEQLASDVRALDAYNDRVARDNERIGAILKEATGEPLAPEPKAWKSWYVDQLGFAYNLMTGTDKPTVMEDVPLNYQPRDIPVQVASGGVIEIRRHSCFGRGTAVRTIEGSRPIESIEVGDLVLAQDTKTGKLSYRPVLMAHHNPPSPTFRVALGDDSIVTSPSHRFWVAGRGWVMARDLKVGDPIRTLGGVAKVASIAPEKVQPVFNLDVADDADFFVSDAAALVHDNTLPDLRQAPFDAPSPVASAAK